MNVKKAIKKIVALGAGLTMIGATIMGATADLGDYPSPFVQNGLFSGKIVVGVGASTSDVLGAIDISASLQAAAKTGVDVEGTTPTTTVSGGVLLEDSSNQDFNWGEYLSGSTIDDTEFPVLLAEGTLEDDDGEEFDYDQEIVVGNETLEFDLVDQDVYDMPVLYLDLDASTNTGYILTYTIDFDSGDEADWENLDDSESIDMFGTTWTIDDIADGGNLVLYGSDVTQLVSLNMPVDVEVDGESYTLNIVGANSEASGGAEVHVSVNGETKAMQDGDTKTVNGLQVFVQDVFVSNIGGESASANLFIGSKELDLGSTFGAGSWTQVQIDNTDLEGVEVRLQGTDSAVDQIDFRIDATEIENPLTGEKYDWLAVGDSFVDPMFGFEVRFVEEVPALMASSRDYFQMKASSDELDVKFTNAEDDEYLFTPYKESATAGNITAETDFVFSQTNLFTEDKIFIVHEDNSSSEPVTKIYEYTGLSDSDSKANFRDLSGGTLSVGDGDALGDSTYLVTIDAANDAVNLSAATVNYIYTKSGTKITFEDEDGTSDASLTIGFEEDEKTSNSDEVPGDNYGVVLTYDTTDNEMNMAIPSSTWDGGNDEDEGGDYDYGVGEYGTYYKQEADENTEIEFWFPSEDVDYRVYLGGPDIQVGTGAATGDATYYNVNPIAVGLGVLDINAPALGSVPMIVVGGPCANTVAAELLGNPAVCGEGFEDGKAFIQYFSAYEAILVAGYEAEETMGATNVLAAYADHADELVGSLVEVLVPSLAQVSINPLG